MNFSCINNASHAVSSTLIDRGVAITASLRPDLEGTFPFVVDRGEGAYVWDRDGQRYIDFTASCGAILLGHRRREVDDAVVEQIRERGTIFPTTLSEPQIKLAERLSSIFPCAERVLFFRTGSCATTAGPGLYRENQGAHERLPRLARLASPDFSPPPVPGCHTFRFRLQLEPA